jgi:hypothetical protein
MTHHALVANRPSRLYIRASRELPTNSGEKATTIPAIHASVSPRASRAHRQVTITVAIPATTDRDRMAASESPNTAIQHFSSAM